MTVMNKSMAPMSGPWFLSKVCHSWDGGFTLACDFDPRESHGV